METPAINRVYLLLAIFNSADVQLEKVVSLYFPHLSEREWKRRASLQQFPFPIFRPERSQKAPWLVNVNALAEYLDKQAADAAKDWRAMSAGRTG